MTDLSQKAGSTKIYLVDGATGALVPACIRRGITAADLERIEEKWQSARSQLAEAKLSLGRGVEHRHWSWTAKAPLLSSGLCGSLTLECNEEPQGVLLYNRNPTEARSTLVACSALYVEFLEAAPWNARTLAARPLYRAVGTFLMQAAASISREKGWEGRVGLYALPQAEGFYQRLGMSRFEPDREHEGLAYYELGTKAASALLSEEQEHESAQ